MEIKITVTDERVNDLLIGHNGELSPWLHSITGTVKDGAYVKFDKEDDEEGAGMGNRFVSYNDMATGIALMATLAPRQFSRFMSEDDDEVTFDTAWQCVIFGKLVYG